MKTTSLFRTVTKGVSINISISEKDKVTYYSYRSARPSIWLTELDIAELEKKDDILSKTLAKDAMSFVRDLIELSNGHLDNHITFNIELANGGNFVVMYHDHKVIIGAGLIVGMW